MDNFRILLVDDDKLFREPMKTFLEKKNFRVDAVTTSAEAIEKVRNAEREYDVALIDQVLVDSDLDGIETMQQILSEYPDLKVIIITGWGEQSSGLRALRAGAYRYISKVTDLEEIELLLQTIAEHKKFRRQLELTEREKEWLSIILKVTQTMQKQLGDRPKILSIITEAVKTLTGADYSAICLRDPFKEKFEIFSPDKDNSSKFLDIDFRRTLQPMGIKILENEQGLNIPDTSKDPHVQKAILEAGIYSLIAVPIEKSGVLYVFGKTAYQFEEETKYILEMLVSHAAVSIQSTFLHEEREQRVTELKQLRDIGKLMAEPVDLTDVLQRIAEGVKSLLKADSAFIWPYNASRNRFSKERVTIAGISDKNSHLIKIPAANGAADNIRKSGYRFVHNVEDAAYENLIGYNSRKFYQENGIRCFAGIPLQAGDETVGILFLNYKIPRPFTDENANTLKGFASEAALAIRKTRLLQQVQRALDHLRTTANFMRLGRIQDILKGIVEGVKDVLQCDAVILYRYEETRDKIIIPPVSIGVYNVEAISDMKDLGPESTLRKVLDQGEYYTNDVSESPFLKGKFIDREGVCSSAGIALKVAKHFLGILFINYRTPYHFTENDKQLFRTFAFQASVAIRNAELFDMERKRQEHLTYLLEAGKAFSASINRDEILNILLSKALEITGISGDEALLCAIYLYDEEKKQMQRTYAFPIEAQIMSEQTPGKIISLKPESNGRIGITGRAIQQKETQWVDDVGKDKDYITWHPGTKSEIAVPLISGERALGVLNVEHPIKGGLDEFDKFALEMLTTQAVIALQKAEQFEELKQTQKMLAARTAVAFMGMASSTWRHEVNKHAATISDNIALASKALQRGRGQIFNPLKKDSAGIGEYFTVMERMVKMIRETPIAAPLVSEEGVECIPVNALIRERVFRIIEARTAMRGIKDVDVSWDLKLPEESLVRISREWLRRAVDLIIQNSLEALEKTPNRDLGIKTLRVKDYAEIHIIDSGSGIPQDVQKLLFQEPIPKKPGESGSGMGLILAQMIVQTYKGNIRIISSDHRGTQMAISLPLDRA